MNNDWTHLNDFGSAYNQPAPAWPLCSLHPELHAERHPELVEGRSIVEGLPPAPPPQHLRDELIDKFSALETAFYADRTLDPTAWDPSPTNSTAPIASTMQSPLAKTKATAHHSRLYNEIT